VITNLRFDDKPVTMKISGRVELSGLRKFGCVMGNEVKTGINVSVLPGTKIKPNAWLYSGRVVR
jgi:bifunctional UDP-N-acetylglucosamine pyrophosphorylase/glucosamine-1-phosphate N-acetyltransferase